MQRIWASVGLIVGLAGLCLQFALTIPSSMEAGRSLIAALVFFFSYFTIQTNIILVLVYGAFLLDIRWLNLFNRPVTRAMAGAVIALVMVFYHVVLRPLWAPEGIWFVADASLHYVTPLIYIGWLVFFARSKTLSLHAIPKMLIYPLAYVGYVMIRGAVITEYPYDIFAANKIGYGQVALNCLLLLIGLSALFALFIGVDRLGNKTKAA